MDPLLRNPLNCWLCLSCAAPGTASPLCLCEIHPVFGGKHKPWHFVENWLLRTLSWQVGFMKNGKVKSLEVSYYSNGGNSADLSHGVSKIFWWLIKQKVFFCATFCPDFRDLLPTALLAHAALWHDWKQILKGFWSFYKCSLSQLTCTGLCHIILMDAVITRIEQRGQECLLCITEGCDGRVVAQCKMIDRSPALGKDSSLEREASQSVGWSGQSA